MNAEMITVPKDEYESYLKAWQKLQCLEAVGVDNWDGYDFAMEQYEESDGELE